ncbi:MAG: N-6 DNA methylase [Treponema sp.]|nr:N-6 DNA methylase [Treponema sp.]
MAKTKSKSSSATIGFEQQIWDAACELWGHIPAADYRKIFTGLIFLKYISTAFEKKYNELVADGDGFENDPDAYESENIFFVPQEARWSEIAKAAHTPEIGTILDKAMNAIEADNRSLKGVLPKNYASPELDKRVLGNVVDVFTNMDMSDTEASKDLLGRTYEYCIAQFASYEGVKGGEFYTPASVVKTIVSILKPTEGKRVYDPCCGSGGMFVQSVKFIQEHAGNRSNISVFGQEANADTWKMAKMNMAIRGIDANFGDHPEDTFFHDLHANQKFDYIMANPPFNLSNWGQDKLQNDPRWAYGLPPQGNANYAWIEHMIYHLAPNGKIGLVLANGALSTQTSGEGEIRRKIIEADLIEGIVALPDKLFYTTGIPVTLWFITRNKKQSGKTLFIDARKLGTPADRTHSEITDENIDKLSKAFSDFQNGTLKDQKGFCAIVDTAKIAKENFVLTPGRYVGIEEQETDGEPFDEKMSRLTTELSELFSKNNELESQIKKNLEGIGYKI